MVDRFGGPSESRSSFRLSNLEFELPLRFVIILILSSLLVGSFANAAGLRLKVDFQGTKSDPEIESEIQSAVQKVLEFSRANELGIDKSDQFITKATVFETKVNFDNFIKATPEWKAGAIVPANYAGFGEKKEFFVVAWPAYQMIHPKDSRKEYQRLLVHEIAHLLHSAFLQGHDDKMGPVWFYEGFACYVADQYKDAAVPRDIGSVVSSPDRGSYRDYAAIFRGLRTKHPVRELLDKASTQDFNGWAISQLRR